VGTVSDSAPMGSVEPVTSDMEAKAAISIHSLR
jgi:hypothetical protein